MEAKGAAIYHEATGNLRPALLARRLHIERVDQLHLAIWRMATMLRLGRCCWKGAMTRRCGMVLWGLGGWRECCWLGGRSRGKLEVFKVPISAGRWVRLREVGDVLVVGTADAYLVEGL